MVISYEGPKSQSSTKNYTLFIMLCTTWCQNAFVVFLVILVLMWTQNESENNKLSCTNWQLV